MDTVDIDTIDDEDVLKQMVSFKYNLNEICLKLNFGNLWQTTVASDGRFR